MTDPSRVCTCGRCAAQEPSLEEQEARWAAYCDARRRADASGMLNDAREAGKAWGRFLDLFLAVEGDRVQ